MSKWSTTTHTSEQVLNHQMNEHTYKKKKRMICSNPEETRLLNQREKQIVYLIQALNSVREEEDFPFQNIHLHAMLYYFNRRYEEQYGQPLLEHPFRLHHQYVWYTGLHRPTSYTYRPNRIDQHIFEAASPTDQAFFREGYEELVKKPVGLWMTRIRQDLRYEQRLI